MHRIFENLNMILEGDIDSISEISKDFADQMNTDMPIIINHVNNGDFMDAKKFAHKLKGSAMNFNGTEIIEHFISLESALSVGNRISSLERCDKILIDLAIFEKLLKTIK